MLLVACGGGGGNGNPGDAGGNGGGGGGGGGGNGDGGTPPPVLPAPLVMRGTAAVGAPVAGGAIAVQCAAGAGLNATTATDGSWSVQTSGQTFPCLVKVSGGNLDPVRYPQGLHSFAQSATNTNVTPLTDLIVAAAVGGKPAEWLAAHSGDLAQALASAAAELPQASASLLAALKDAGYAVGSGDPFDTPFNPAAGDPYDDLLEAVGAALADAGLSHDDLLASAADGNTGAVLPGADEIGAEAIAAMPQLNDASLTVTAGVLTMKTVSQGGNAIGAFVGGGTGNKAVLQLAGLQGTKLSQIKRIEFETRYLGGNRNLGPYLSLLVDLRCNLSPPSSGATLADMRAQRRTIGFSPSAAGLYTEGFYASTAFSTITVTHTTPGWYITGTPTLGMVPNTQTVDLGTLDAFDFATYPDACIVDGVSGDAGLARDATFPACATTAALAATDPAYCAKPHAGVLFSVSDSSSTAAREWEIRRVKVNERSFSFR